MGDNIIGYVSKGYGIVVHRLECLNVKRNVNNERFIEVIWDRDFNKKVYESLFRIISFDRKNIVAEIINVINSTSATILSISSGQNRDGELVTKVKVTVSNVEELNNVFANLQKISDVYRIERILR